MDKANKPQEVARAFSFGKKTAETPIKNRLGNSNANIRSTSSGRGQSLLSTSPSCSSDHPTADDPSLSAIRRRPQLLPDLSAGGNRGPAHGVLRSVTVVHVADKDCPVRFRGTRYRRDPSRPYRIVFCVETPEASRTHILIQ
jgi:hypothetical protein